MPSPYCWVITQDVQQNKLPGEKSLVGVMGPRGCHLTMEEIKYHPKAQCFRLRDDDKEVYAIGYFVDLKGNASGFEPKDDYGEPSLGCTDIQYRQKNGVWESL